MINYLVKKRLAYLNRMIVFGLMEHVRHYKGIFFLLFLFSGRAFVASSATPFYSDKTNLCHFIDSLGHQREIRSPEEWELRRQHIFENMQKVMGPLPHADRTNPPEFEIIEEINTPHYVRKHIRYSTEPWDKVNAFLFLPRNGDIQQRVPAMLCLHPTSPLGKRVISGEGTTPNHNYAVELAERGYVVLAPDYPGFGDNVLSRQRLYEHGYVSCTMKGIWNHIRGIDLLQSLPEVEPTRIGCIGHSLGGHNTLFLGVFDQRIRICVSSCGFTTFPKYRGGDLTGWTHDGYMPLIAKCYNKDPRQMPFDFTEILGALAPRPVFINAPLHDANFDVSGVRDALQAARSIYQLFNSEDLLTATFPDTDHDFPLEDRHAAYMFLDSYLK